MGSMLLRHAVVVLTGAAAALPLSALSAKADGPVREACKAEFEKFCKDVPDGGGRVRTCLDDHANEASETCRAALGAHAPAKDAEPKPNGAHTSPAPH